jgi:hypothetical protein
LRTGDAAAITGEDRLVLTGGELKSSEVLLFDVR